MKFVNYGMPTGLGIKEFNTKTHKHSNLNGITKDEEPFVENTNDKIIISFHYEKQF